MSYDPTDINAHRAAAAEAVKQRELQRKQQAADFVELMSTRVGRRFIWRMLDVAGVFRSTFRTSAEGAFLEGQRNIGLMLMADIHELCPERYVEMLNEAKEQQQ